jgi:hypothetical protein
VEAVVEVQLQLMQVRLEVLHISLRQAVVGVVVLMQQLPAHLN